MFGFDRAMKDKTDRRAHLQSVSFLNIAINAYNLQLVSVKLGQI